MSPPARIRINASVPFPAQVQGSGVVSLSKVAGIWTVGVSFPLLAIQSPSSGNFPTDYVLVYDSIAKVYFQCPLSTIAAAAAGASYRIVTAAGDVTVLVTDQVLLMNKTVGAATNIFLPTSASRSGTPVTIKDYKGDSLTNNITIVPQSGETIDGYSAAASVANGAALIRVANDKRVLYPLTAGGWYM
jgi:hypothetical protein